MKKMEALFLLNERIVILKGKNPEINKEVSTSFLVYPFKKKSELLL